MGLLIASGSLWLVAAMRRIWHKTNYDELFKAAHPALNPLDTTFSNARIYLNEFVLPSNPNIVGKNFIDCEIIGPANIFLNDANTIPNLHGPMLDAVRLDPGAQFFNGFSFSNCVFRGCSFHKITLFVRHEEYPYFKGWSPLNWVSEGAVDEPPLPLELTNPAAATPTLSPQDTEEEKQP